MAAKSLPASRATRLLLRDSAAAVGLKISGRAAPRCSNGLLLARRTIMTRARSSAVSTSTEISTNKKYYSTSVRPAKRSLPEAQSTAASSVAAAAGTVQSDASRAETTADYADPAYHKIDLSFENAKEAYMSKTNAELLRCYVVFQLCTVNAFVEKNKQLIKLARRVLGKWLFEKVMKASFYGHFVAGEDAQIIKPLVHRNMMFGVKSILDYSVEKDISREEARAAEIMSCGVPDSDSVSEDDKLRKRFSAHYEFGDRRELVTSARTYFYQDEAMCDDNVKHFIEGIDAVSTATNATGFAAVKLTALGRPQFLLQLSAVLTAVRRYFEMLSSGYGTGTIKEDDLERHLRSFNLDPDERRRWFTILDVSRDGEIDLLDWHNLLEVNVGLGKVLRIPNLKTGQLDPLTTGLSEVEEEQMKNMLHRVDYIVRYAKERDVRVMIDAEQTYFQAAINRLCMEMMRTYNREKAYVFNTYQCYTKDAFNVLTTDLALSKREDFFFGAKLVRGAYMDQERLRAATLGYEDPIMPSFEATTRMYETCLTEVLKQINEREKGKIAVMVATHNEDTVKFTINKMREYGVKSTDRLICFGQLYGMSDQLSFSLGQAGYSVYKYVPYGPVEEVLPYLSRRAVENRGVLKKVKKEKRLLRTELTRRMLTFDWFYRPPTAAPHAATVQNSVPSVPEPAPAAEKRAA